MSATCGVLRGLRPSEAAVGQLTALECPLLKAGALVELDIQIHTGLPERVRYNAPLHPTGDRPIMHAC
jgi:hypothetical protein